jgi:hypothetical protein
MCTYVHMHVLGGRLARAAQRHITHDAAGRGAPHTTHCTPCTQFPKTFCPKRQSYWLTCAAAGCSASSKGTHPMQERSLAKQSRSVAVAAPTRSTAHKIVACSTSCYQLNVPTLSPHMLAHAWPSVAKAGGVQHCTPIGAVTHITTYSPLTPRHQCNPHHRCLHPKAGVLP